MYVVQSKWWLVYPFGHETQLNNNDRNISINILDSVHIHTGLKQNFYK